MILQLFPGGVIRNGGRPAKNKKDIDTAIKMYDSKLHSVADIEKTTGVSKATLYRYIKKRRFRPAFCCSGKDKEGQYNDCL